MQKRIYSTLTSNKIDGLELVFNKQVLQDTAGCGLHYCLTSCQPVYQVRIKPGLCNTYFRYKYTIVGILYSDGIIFMVSSTLSRDTFLIGVFAHPYASDVKCQSGHNLYAGH